MSAASTATDQMPPPRRTFHRRVLPDTCTALSSQAGRAKFNSAMAGNGLKCFFPLMEQHSTQAEPAYCGVSTLTICLNTLAVDPRQTWKGPWRWYVESQLNCCMDMEEIKRNGITIAVFDCLAKCQGLSTEVHYAINEEGEELSIETFRAAVEEACVEPDDYNHDTPLNQILVVSYDRGSIGQTGTGHFSPLAAYDRASDSVLVLDTARFKYPVHWVKLPDLFAAMKPIDPDSKRSRGFVMLRKEEDDDHQAPHLPVSLLLRIKAKDQAERKEYKHFLKSLEGPVHFEDVASYWTRNGQTVNRVWHLAEPQTKPCDDEYETLALVTEMRALVTDLVPADLPKQQGCRYDRLRFLDLQPKEVLLIAYLASLEKDTCLEIVNAKTEYSEAARQQLLAEAELLSFAIEMSDDMA